ncbi:hypothetical protein EWM64_g7194 [Hericium alpestre]|uniref:RING-type domain-containing protein n=1 Tax=Hericium alpestre TaxID=135208 RepID=A0A4Y9ZTJ7_9AGAM|nr:hypothetical protein EWM64_g7194 [Hericium alpestre]
MLILHPSSACDICIEPFVLEATHPNHRRAPCVIECGHVFCDSCLDSFQQTACPLCRTPFDERLIRKIHIDIKPLLPSDRSPMPTVPEQLEAEKHRIKDRLTAMMRDGASGRERETVLNEAKDWLRKNDPHEQHAWDLRGPYLLVVRYQDLNKENQSALMDAHESRKQHEEMRILLAEQTEAAEDEIDSLRHALVEERAKAAAVEKSLKDHNYRVEIAWTQKYEDVLSEVRALREELRFFAQSSSSRRDRYDDYDGHRSHASLPRHGMSLHIGKMVLAPGSFLHLIFIVLLRPSPLSHPIHLLATNTLACSIGSVQSTPILYKDSPIMLLLMLSLLPIAILPIVLPAVALSTRDRTAALISMQVRIDIGIIAASICAPTYTIST